MSRISLISTFYITPKYIIRKKLHYWVSPDTYLQINDTLYKINLLKTNYKTRMLNVGGRNMRNYEYKTTS